MVSENRPDHGQFVGGHARRSHTRKIMRTGCGQEEPGSIMQVKLATRSCPEESLVVAHIKANPKVFKKPISPNLIRGCAQQSVCGSVLAIIWACRFPDR